MGNSTISIHDCLVPSTASDRSAVDWRTALALAARRRRGGPTLSRSSFRRWLWTSSSLTAAPLSAPVVGRHDESEAPPPTLPAVQSSGLIPRVGPPHLRLPPLVVFTGLKVGLLP